MTKKDLVDTIAADTGVTKADSELMLDAITKAIADCLVSGDSIRLPALGSFKVGTVASKVASKPDERKSGKEEK